MKKKVVVKIDKKKKANFKIKRITCEIYADPHVHGFNQKYFNAQTVGDWVIYRGENLSAHYRGKSFGSWVGIVKYGVKLFDAKIYSVAFNLNKLIINGEERNIPNGITKLSNGGIIQKNGNKLTFSSGRGEDVDFVSYGWFYNTYVRSDVPKISGLCSQEFVHSHFFNHYEKAHRIEIKKEHCPKKMENKQRCLAAGINKPEKVRFCVRDLCNGLPMKIEDKILIKNINEKEKKIVKIVKRVQRITCQLVADPHVQGFNTHWFEAQTAGDWVLYRGSNLSVHYRGKSMGRWVGLIKFGVRLFHHRVFSVGFSLSKLIIDGEQKDIPNGKTQIGHRAVVIRNGNKVTFSTGDGEEVDFLSYGYFFNAYTRSSAERVTGLCSQQFVHSHFFAHEQHGEIEKIKEQHCARKEEFKKNV